MLEFEFDTGNLKKLAVVKILRGIDLEEILSVFEDENKQVYPAKNDMRSSEQRFMVVGMSSGERILSVIFTMRNNKIRPFNAWQTKGKKKSSYFAKH